MITASKLLLASGSIYAAYGLDVMQTTTSERLRSLRADPNSVTMSGSSAGAQMSCHMLTVLSGIVKGAGCSKGGAFNTSWRDFKSSSTSTDLSDRAIGEINALNASGTIDPIENLTERAVYIISSDDDPTVPYKN